MAVKKQPVRSKHQDKETNDILEREKQALHLRKAGASYRAIGDQLGISHEQARRDVETALSHIRDDVTHDAVKLRDLELARLDDMLLKLQPRLSSENERVSDRAYGRAMQIIEQRAKLGGLYAAQKFEQVTPESQLIAALRARANGVAGNEWATWQAVVEIYDGDTSLAEKLFREANVPIER